MAVSVKTCNEKKKLNFLESNAHENSFWASTHMHTYIQNPELKQGILKWLEPYSC